MGSESRPCNPSGHGRVKRVQVKTGCRTCKIRKVKCDETRPCCRRCVSTGRKCDGYGVWNSTARKPLDQLPPAQSHLSFNGTAMGYLRPALGFSFFSTAIDQECFEWFRCRTSKKISGASTLALFDTLLCAACPSEPAVFHAVLSLSALHRRDIYESGAGDRNESRQRRRAYGEIYSLTKPDEQEEVVLQHYSRAIQHLLPPFSITDKASLRATLMTCFVLVCLELLRGHVAVAQTHLDNGLRLLRELGVPTDEHDGILLFQSAPDPVDDAIFKAFCRLDLQSKLFGDIHNYPYQALHTTERSSHIPAVYLSVAQAWRQIESFLGRIFYLTELGRRQQISENLDPKHLNTLFYYQRDITMEIASSLQTLEVSTDCMLDQDSRGLTYGLLILYHNMAAIMADTCLRFEDESVFDRHTQRFSSILNRSIVMWKAGQPDLQGTPIRWPRIHMSSCIVDIGWIAPLYYTSVKCRVHCIRLHAIRLIETTSYREGMWDSRTASCVARRVMEIEEEDFHRDLNWDYDDFSLASAPEGRTAPLQNRICEIHMVLPDCPVTPVILHYRRVLAEWEQTFIFQKGSNTTI